MPALRLVSVSQTCKPWPYVFYSDRVCMAPDGRGRLWQVFRNQFTGAKMACVDMRFQYREA